MRIHIYDLRMNNKALAIVVPEVKQDKKERWISGYQYWLVSYATAVACIDTDGEFKMLVEPGSVSRTTAKHINKFIDMFVPNGVDWHKCKVFVPEV